MKVHTKDGHSQEIMDSIRRIVRALRVSSRAAEKKLGVSGAQLFVLQKLSGDRALSINELAARTMTHQSSVSTVVSRLIAQSLVARRLSPRDGRRVELELTARGRALLSEARPAVQESLVHAIRKMPRKDGEKLSRLLSSLVSEAGFSEESPSLFFEDKER